MVAEIDSYTYYSDSPDILHSVNEWRELDKKHLHIKVDLPEGWPKKLTGPHVWRGEELRKNPEKYKYYFTLEDLSEIHKAVKKFKQLGLPLRKVGRENFNLGSLGSKLEDFSEDLYKGIGVRLLRGFNIDDYDEQERLIAYLGISSYIGDIRDAQGLNRALTHIKSIAHVPKEERAPIGVSQQTTDPQMYHSDFGGDIVSLLVLGTPANGGESLISSTYSIYNYLAQHRPDIIKVLTSPEGYKRKGFPEGAPLIFYENDELITSFSTRNFIGFGEIPRDKSYPLISSEERDAVGGFNAIAYKYTLETDLQKGDIEYVNNLINQHCRKGYLEDEDHRRHLARLWLRNSKYTFLLKLPQEIKEKRNQIFPVEYEQEIPLNEFEEDEIKVKSGADSIDKFYAKPK
jgi:hypothetical protein